MTERNRDQAQRQQQAYELALSAQAQLGMAAARLPEHDPAHQELDQARLAVKVALDVMRP